MTNSLSLLSGRLLARNVVWNLAGTALPLLVAVWTLPVLIAGMGNERFGLLAIIWMGVGYFSFFDLGIGRALTKLVTERLGDGREAELPVLIVTGSRLMYALGLVAALLVGASAPWLAGSLLNVPSELVGEAKWSFLVLAATLPFVVATAGYIGILQAYQRFPAINAVRIPQGIFNFLGPVLALGVTRSLVATTLALAASRILAWLTYRWLCRSYTDRAGGRCFLDREAVRQLLRFGSWITVTNVISPLMLYFDRLVIGSLLTMAAVAYYTMPYEIVTRFWIVPDAMAGVLFPALAMALAVDFIRARALFMVAARVLLAAIFLPTAFVVLFAPEVLTLWLGVDFAKESAPVLRWLAVGVFVNSFARLPFITLQGHGRPDLTAKLHLLQLPLYFIGLWKLIEAYGIVGAAAAWTLRIMVDAVALFFLAGRYVPAVRSAQHNVLATVSAGALLFGSAVFLEGFWLKAIVGIFLILGTGIFALREIRSIAGGTSVVTGLEVSITGTASGGDHGNQHTLV